MCETLVTNSDCTTYIARCGEIFMTVNHALVLHCTLCDEQHQVYDKFMAHIFAYHCDDSHTQAQQCAEADDTNSEDIVNPEAFVTEGASEDEDLELIQRALETEAVSMTEPQTEISAPTAQEQQVDTPDSDNNKKGYKCDYCGLIIKQRFNWRYHIRRHIEPKRFKCTQCDRAFHTRSELKIHERRHNRDLPFVCAYCGRGFVARGVLTMHERKHNNIRPHKCDYCGKCFADTVLLRRHIVMHTKERNFECQVCNGKFSHKNVLRQHMKLHLNAREYVCNLCGKAFNQRPAMLMHKKTKHKLISNEVKTVFSQDEII